MLQSGLSGKAQESSTGEMACRAGSENKGWEREGGRGERERERERSFAIKNKSFDVLDT